MSWPTLDTNAWYAIRNVGTGNFLAAGSPITDNTSVVTTTAVSDHALWQIADYNTGYQITWMRTKATGSDYCMALNQRDMMRPLPDDSITLPVCNYSAWVVSDYEKPAGAEGYYFALSFMKFISAMSDGLGVFPRQYNNTADLVNNSLWTFSSVSAVNDKHYSTVPNYEWWLSTTTMTTATAITDSDTATASATATVTGSSEPTDSTSAKSPTDVATPGWNNWATTVTAKSTPTAHPIWANATTSNTTSAGSVGPTSPSFNAASTPKVTVLNVLSAFMLLSAGLHTLSF